MSLIFRSKLRIIEPQPNVTGSYKKSVYPKRGQKGNKESLETSWRRRAVWRPSCLGHSQLAICQWRGSLWSLLASGRHEIGLTMYAIDSSVPTITYRWFGKSWDSLRKHARRRSKFFVLEHNYFYFRKVNWKNVFWEIWFPFYWLFTCLTKNSPRQALFTPLSDL